MWRIVGSVEYLGQGIGITDHIQNSEIVEIFGENAEAGNFRDWDILIHVGHDTSQICFVRRFLGKNRPWVVPIGFPYLPSEAWNARYLNPCVRPD
jgi:hypothetical protein